MHTKKLVTKLLVITLLVVGGVAFAQSGRRGFVPGSGFVPDAITALKIAEAVLTPVYGQDVIASEHPFRAVLKGNIWIVTGSVPCNDPAGRLCPGGAAEVHISRKDGRVTFMGHGQ